MLNIFGSKKSAPADPNRVVSNQLVISFDTTGSMYSVIAQVKRHCEALAKEYFKVVPDAEIAVIAHGDYCDAGSTYVTSILPFTSDPAAVTAFIRGVELTGGGDAPECYELVLHQSRRLAWRDGANKVLVLFGDDVPHGASERQNTKKLDWRNETDLLTTMGVKVYGVQCLRRPHARHFYHELAQRTSGFHLEFDQFAQTPQLLLSIFHFQQGSEQLLRFEEEQVKRGTWSRNMDSVVGIFTGRTASVHYAAPEYELVPDGRFLWFDVLEDIAAPEFVKGNGLPWEKRAVEGRKIGRGFYELTKSELIQEGKEVLVFDHATKDIYTGKDVRELIGLPYGVRGNVSPHVVPPGKSIFVRSDSPNRKLKRGQRYLFDITDLSNVEPSKDTVH